MKRTQRTTTSTLAGPTAMTELSNTQLGLIGGGITRPTKWTFRPPQDPDDIFRLVDE